MRLVPKCMGNYVMLQVAAGLAGRNDRGVPRMADMMAGLM